MKRQRELHFAPPNVEGFLEALAPLWANAFAQVELIGDNDLSAAIESAAEQHGVAIEHCAMPDTASRIRGKRLIIFTETDGAKLGAQLLSCIDLNNVVVVASVTDWHFSRKPLFLISIPKAGTHLLYELAQALGYRPGVELPEFPLPQTWYCVEYGNSHTVAQDFFVDTVRRSPFGNRHHPFPKTPALFIYRHPLDILVSEANYYHRDGKTVFSAYFDRLDFDARVTRLMQDRWLLGSLRERIGGFLPWLEFPNVVPFSFEELIGTRGGGDTKVQLDLIWSIQLKLQAPGIDAEIAGKVFNPDADTFREGQIGGYLKQLPPEFIGRFAAENPDILAQLGYPEDGSPAIPRKGPEHRSKAIQYSQADYSHMPLTVESGYLGCNLVQYEQRVYAVPMAAGPIALEKLAPETLGELPVAPTLAGLKSLLLIGKTRLAEHATALDQLAAALRLKTEVPAASRFWSDPVGPRIVEEYKGFNLIAWRGIYLGLRQSLGSVELPGDIEEIDRIAAQRTIGDLLISSTVTGLRNDIEMQSIALEADRHFKVLAQRLDVADAWQEAVRQQAQDQQRQVSDADRRADESTQRIAETANLLARLREQWDAAQIDAEAKHHALAQLAQELATQMREAGQRADETTQRIAETANLLARLRAQWDAAQLDAEAQHQAAAQLAQELATQMREAGQRADAADRRADETSQRLAETASLLAQLREQWGEAQIDAEEKRQAVMQLTQELATQMRAAGQRADTADRRADETTQRLAETANLLARLREQWDAAQIDTEAKHQAVSQFAQELATQLRDAGQRADETDRLFNQLLEHFDATRSEAELRHRAVAQQLQDLHALARIVNDRTDEADRKHVELQQRFNSHEASIAEEHRATRQQASALQERASHAEDRASAAENRLQDLYDKFAAAQVEARAEQLRLQARLDELQNQTNILERNLFVRIGRKIGRFLRMN